MFDLSRGHSIDISFVKQLTVMRTKMNNWAYYYDNKGDDDTAQVFAQAADTAGAVIDRLKIINEDTHKSV